MRDHDLLGALGATVTLLLVAGCAGSGSAIAPTAGTHSISHQIIGNHLPSVLKPEFANRIQQGTSAVKGWMSKAASSNPFRIYASQPGHNSITVYKESGNNQSPIGVITNGLSSPNGMWATPNGDLYVANEGNSNILIFHPGAMNAYKTLDDSGQYPVDVTVGADGTVYASNIIDLGFNQGSVSVYANGSTTPTSMLQIPNNQDVYFLGLSKDNTLYVNYIDKTTHATAMVKFRNATGAAKPTGVTFTFPGGMQFDNTGDLVACDQGGSGSNGQIDIFELPNKTPSFVFGQNNGDPIAERLNRNERRIYIADVIGGVINVYAYPSGVQVNTISNGLGHSDPPVGLAVDLGAPL